MVGDGKPQVAGHITYRAVLPTKEVPEHLRRWSMTFWAGEKVHFVIYPLRGGELYNLVAVFHSNRYEEGWDSFGDPAELHERFAKTCEPVRILLGKIESWRMWVLCDRPPVKNWSNGRITLLGDAAHPMLQYLAQGACMAVEDAVCLANRVATAQGDYAAAFQAYQDARYLRTGRVQIMARVYGEFYHAERRRARAAQHDAVGAHARAVVRGDGVALRRGQRSDRLRAGVCTLNSYVCACPFRKTGTHLSGTCAKLHSDRLLHDLLDLGADRLEPLEDRS